MLYDGVERRIRRVEVMEHRQMVMLITLHERELSGLIMI